MKKLSFVEWLKEEADKKGLSQAEIARKGSLSKSQVSRVFSMTIAPSQEFILAISRVFQLSPEVVFIKAGLLPERNERNEKINEVVHILEQLDEENQSDVAEYVRLRLEIQERRGNYEAKTLPAK